MCIASVAGRRSGHVNVQSAAGGRSPDWRKSEYLAARVQLGRAGILIDILILLYRTVLTFKG